MTENSINTSFRNILACCLMFAVIVASSTFAWALPENKSATGELSLSGRGSGDNTPFALLNGERAFSGRTFFSASTIATTAENDATLKLGKLGSIVLSTNSILSLTFGDNKISGNLIAGQVKVFSNEGVEVKIQTADKVVSNDLGRNDILTVAAQNGAALASAGDSLNGEVSAVPVQSPTPTATQTTTDDNSYVGPLAIFGGVVAVAAIYVITHNNDDSPLVVSPTR